MRETPHPNTQNASAGAAGRTKPGDLSILLTYGALAAVIALMVGLFARGLSRAPDVRQAACMALSPRKVDVPAKDFTLKDINGNNVQLSRLKGSVVLLHFWATWCPPCVEELPSLYRMQTRIRDKDLKLLTVSADDSPDIVKRFFAENRVPPLPVVVDKSKTVATTFGTEKLPDSYLIDRDGIVRYHFVNKRNWSSKPALTCLKALLR